jgi:hypothetical protein
MTMRHILHKKLSLTALILFLACFFTGCGGPGDKGTRTKITGYFPAFKGRSVTLSEIDVDKAIPLDTARISDNGKFSFKFRRPAAGFYLIKVDNKNYITLVLDQETAVEVTSENKELRKGYEVEGSEDSKLYGDFEMFLETNRLKVDSLTMQYKDYQKSAGFESMKLQLDENYKRIFDSMHDYSVAFFTNHCQSLASLLVINRRFGQRKIMDEETDFPYFIQVDSCMSKKYPQNKHYLAFHKKVAEMSQIRELRARDTQKLAAGNKAPDITLENPSGNKVTLYSLEGSPVIVYVWSSINQQSRKANQQLKKSLSVYRGPKLKVFAIALESYKDMWVNAVKNDGIEQWINVTDYLNVHSGATSLYGVPDELPYFLLLDKSLRIVYRGSDFGMLDEKLKDLDK